MVSFLTLKNRCQSIKKRIGEILNKTQEVNLITISFVFLPYIIAITVTIGLVVVIGYKIYKRRKKISLFVKNQIETFQKDNNKVKILLLNNTLIKVSKSLKNINPIYVRLFYHKIINKKKAYKKVRSSSYRTIY